ncbi:MAG TPA: NAD(P)H-dependent glycerol-3-phosphate dehydrogenase, partial [Jeotgalicoccus sp.]|nr:NAD(P)H-dependent glycerol-3-phosphate dehydrogenase [Jeotgalicoccus sp.]
PTTVSAASVNESGRKIVQDTFINKHFRVYENKDLIGVEVGGALKNIIAIAIGILDGLGFGDNTKSAVITRGLHEIARLGTKMGADPLTFMGLTGVGDLIVTAMSEHSRNFRCGKMLASGQSLDDIIENMGMVVEGVNTTKAAYELSNQFNIDMPITNVLYLYLFEGLTEDEAFFSLMMREKTSETDGLIELMKNRVDSE